MWIDYLGHGRLVQRPIEEVDNTRDLAAGFGHHVAVVDVKCFDVRTATEPLLDQFDVAGKHGRDRFVVHLVRVFAAMDDHLPLRGQDFLQVAAQENNLVGLIGRQILQQKRDDLDRLTTCLGQPGDVALVQLFDALKLEIALGIILVGGAQFIGERRNAARGQHLHHHRRSRTR